MPMLADLIIDLLTRSRPDPQRDTPRNNDSLLTFPPTEGDDAGKIMTPEQYARGRDIRNDKRNVYDDSGKIVDYDMGAMKNDPITDFLRKQMLGVADNVNEGVEKGNPFKELLQKSRGEQGTILGTLGRLFTDKPERENRAITQPGTIGPDGSGATPGTGVDPALNPTPLKNQKMRQFNKRGPIDPNNGDLDRVPTTPAVDYSQPTALDPNQIEELRQSLLTGAGQLDPNNPNGLSGRMNSPNAQPEMRQQGQDAENIANGVRNGYRSSEDRSPFNRK